MPNLSNFVSSGSRNNSRYEMFFCALLKNIPLENSAVLCFWFCLKIRENVIMNHWNCCSCYQYQRKFYMRTCRIAVPARISALVHDWNYAGQLFSHLRPFFLFPLSLPLSSSFPPFFSGRISINHTNCLVELWISGKNKLSTILT